MRFILLTIVSLLSGFISFSQLGSATLTTDKCAHIFTRIDANYNNTTFDVSTVYNRGVTYYSRGFIEFDLSSIPSDAIIISATLKITNAGGTYVVNPWVAKLVQSDWVETTVKASDQPDISDATSDWETSYTTSGNDVEIDVKSTVQRMVYRAVDNYGWCIQVQNEAVAYDSGTSFHSDEVTSDQPELTIEYYRPVTFSNVVITHESATSAADGSISFSHTALDGTGHTYTWYNSSGYQLQSGSTSTIEDLSYGWYGLKIKGNTNEETFYYGFLVGTECEEVEISYSTTPEYTSNAIIYDRVYSGGVDCKDVNYGNHQDIRTQNWEYSGVWTDMKSYLSLNTWMDDAFTVNQADLELVGESHYNAYESNETVLNKVISFWNEDLITWNADPSHSSVASVTIPNTSSTTQNAVIDMVPLWEDWKVNNADNYGVLIQIESFDDDFGVRQMYHSPTEANVTDRPTMTFKLALFEGESCVKRHAILDYKMDGSYYVMKDGKIRFVFNQEYDAEDLTFTIYNGMDEIVFTDANFPAVATTHGKNYLTLDVSNSSTCLDGKGFFYLEVINSKKERMYLRFYNDFDDCESLPTE